MRVLSRAQIVQGTGFPKRAKFVEVQDPDLRTILGAARAFVVEAVHADRDFRVHVLCELDRLLAAFGEVPS